MIEAGTNGVTGPWAAKRTVNRCQEAMDPATANPFHELLSLAPTICAGPMVAPLGGIDDRSPLWPNSVQGILQNAERGEFNDPGANLHKFFQGGSSEDFGRGLDVSDVPGPTDPAVANVGATQIVNHLPVVFKVGICGTLDLLFRRSQSGSSFE